MIRRTRIFKDTQDVFKSLLASKTAAPWNRWTVIAGYPNETVFKVFTKPFIFVSEPIVVEKTFQQGGSVKNYKLNLRIGSWVSLQNGGAEELAIMVSELLNLFDDPYTCNSLTFDTEIGSTTYTNTTLKAMHLSVLDITIGGLIEYKEDSQLRQDVNLTLITNL